MICIYKITSPTNKIYIGQSWDWVKRKSVYKRSACPNQLYLYNSLKKYGWEAHKIEILLIFTNKISQESLDFYETYWWKFYKKLGFKMLNIKKPGSNGKLSEETKKKLSKALKGRKLSQEWKDNIGKGLKGRTVSEETRIKIGLGNKGKIISEVSREKIRNKLTGKKLSKDIIEKIRISHIGKKCSENTKLKISKANTGVKNGMFGRTGLLNKGSKKVIDIATGTIFHSISEAEKTLNINKGVLVNKLNGRTKNNTSLQYV